MEYEDFSIRIEPRRGDVYPVSVVKSPAGEGRGEMRLPFDLEGIGDILADLGSTVRSAEVEHVRAVSQAATQTPAQKVGDQLYGAAFVGTVRSLFDRSLGMVQARQHGLRIKLHIDPEQPELAQLASLPWEFLYRKETRDFFNLSQSTPLVRYLDVQRPYRPLDLEPPLRVLAVTSEPADCPPLGLSRERELIEASWADQDAVQVDFAEHVTVLGVQDRMADQPYHVLHYMGHGDFDERTGRGVLVMEDDQGLRADVDGATLGVLLRDVATLRLVFLNACETARATREKGLDPFAGVASALVLAGIPAVVAMQFPITDRAAIRFSQRFYELLAQGNPVDAAVAAGRQVIRVVRPNTMEWGTPVLFMRAPQGDVFHVGEVPRKEILLSEMPDEQREVDEALERRLSELYQRGEAAYWTEKWQEAIRCFEAVRSIQPDYEGVAESLNKATRRARLAAIYEQARAASQAQDWSAAITALDQLVSDAPDFKDAESLLRAARKEKQLADLYAKARALYEAGHWEAVIRVFDKIAEIVPGYADAEKTLDKATEQLEKQRHAEQLRTLYSQALTAMNEGDWAAAAASLHQIREMEPGYLETPQLLAKARSGIAKQEAERQRREQIAELYMEARLLADAAEWERALAKVREIEALDAQFADPKAIAQRARHETDRQQRLETLYARAVSAMEAEDWDAALGALEELVAEAPDFRDVTAVLQEARKQKHVADLCAKARRLHQAQEWEAAIRVFGQITEIEPDCADVQGLLDNAKEQLETQRREEKLGELYSQALTATDGGDWAAAQALLNEIGDVEPGYREVPQLLAKVQSEIARLERIAALYREAERLANAAEWHESLAKVQEIEALDVGFADPEGIAQRAREGLDRQQRLETLYARAQSGMEDEDWETALGAVKELVAEAPGFRDAPAVLQEARKQKRVADPYAKARQLHQAQEWECVIQVFSQVAGIEGHHADPEGILDKATEEVHRQRSEEKLRALYSRALTAMDAGEWKVARTLLNEVAELEPGYRETAHLLARVRGRAARPELGRLPGGHTGMIWSADVTPDGLYIVSGSQDNTIKVWELASGRLMRSLEGHTDQVLSVMMTPDGVNIVSGSRDDTIKVWELASGRLLRSLEGHPNSGVTSIAVTTDGAHVVSGSPDKTIKVWDLATGRLVRTLEGHTDWVWSVAVTPDGAHVVSGSRDKTIKVWDLATGRLVRTLEGHTDWVWSVAVTPDGAHVVSGSVGTDTTIKVWELASGRLLRSLEEQMAGISSIEVTPDGAYIVSGSEDTTIKVWQLASGRLVHSLKGHTNTVWSVAVTPDGLYVVSGSSDNTIKVWELASGRLLRSLGGHAGHVYSVTVTPDGLHVVSGSQDTTIRVWELARGRLLRSLEGHANTVCSVAVTPDGAHVVSGSHDKTIKVWELASGRLVRSLEGHANTVSGVAVTPDGAHVVSGSHDKTIKVWELVSGRLLRSLEGYTGILASPISVVISPDGEHVVSGAQKTVKIWELGTGRLVRSRKGHTGFLVDIRSIAVSPDGEHVVSGATDNAIKVWELASGRLLRSLEGHAANVLSVAVTPDGAHVVSGSDDATIKVWDLTSGRLLRSLEAHTGGVNSVAVTPDGEYVVSGADDNSLIVWEIGP